jgi:hypothetical protein
MKLKNTILLIILRNQGIAYNELLSKIASNYSSINSARAALSRTVKDFSVLGIITRKEGRLYVTDKGSFQLASEMKNKLIAQLNETIKSKQSIREMDTIVQQLATLIARAKEDEDLRRIAKGSATFHLSDLRKIQLETEKEISHVQYLSAVFNEQIVSLEEFGFNDSKKISASELETCIVKVFTATESSEAILESDEETMQKAGELIECKPRGNKLTIPLSKAKELMKKIAKEPLKEKITVYLHPIKIELHENHAIIKGPFEKLKILSE